LNTATGNAQRQIQVHAVVAQVAATVAAAQHQKPRKTTISPLRAAGSIKKIQN
jgi:RNase P/RNase MRP subunit POP5